MPKKQIEMRRSLPTKYIVLCLALFVAVALFIRVYYPFDQVFTPEGVKFTANDAYYHMRLIDNLAHNFPKMTFYDQFYITPGMSTTVGAHFFDWMLAAITWVIGLGHPNESLVNMVGTYTPAVMGAFVVIPVYVLCKSLLNRTAGLIAAAIMAVIPGEFLGRSVLGAADHHVAEVLLSVTAIMFLVLAIKSTDKKIISIYAILAGLFLGLYLNTWVGGLIIVAIISIYFIIQITINHFKNEGSLSLAVIGVLMLGVATIVSISKDSLQTLIMAGATLLPFMLAYLSKWTVGKKLLFPIMIVCSGVLVLALLRVLAPDTLNLVALNLTSVFHPMGSTGATTLELQPILSPNGHFTFVIAWGNFTTLLYCFPVALVLISWLFVKQKAKDKTWLLLIIWTSIMFFLMITQRRYAYYFAVNAAILSGYLIAQLIHWAGKFTRIGRVAAAVILLPIVILPSFFASKDIAANQNFTPSDAWQTSLLWMKGNTPEPIGNGEAYYSLYLFEVPYAKTPKASYGVTAWWDYGYWITRIAHRVPSANPGQSPEPIKKVANLFLSQDEATTNRIIDELGTKYIILDSPMTTSKFYAVADWAGQDDAQYQNIYYVSNPKTGTIDPVRVYYPEYYRTLSVRLFNFDCNEVAENPIVITFTNEKSNGTSFKYIRDARQFTSYQEAEYFVSGKENTFIVGTSPFVSPIKLPALPEFTLVHKSNDSEVKIFEYIR
jgi:dolichyl-diphosphooligosaccharide--protein glycosyltransferase